MREKVEFVLPSSAIWSYLYDSPARPIAALISVEIDAQRPVVFISHCPGVKCDWACWWAGTAASHVLPSSPSLSLSNDQHAEGSGESACLLALSASCAAWQWSSASWRGEGRRGGEGRGGFVWILHERKRQSRRDWERKYVWSCELLIRYTQKVTVIYAARLSPHFGAALVFSHAVCQSASTSFTMHHRWGKEAGKTARTACFKSCLAHWHTSNSLSRTSTHHSDIHHWNTAY